MSELQQIGGLQIGQDMAVQRRHWILERVGWALMLLSALAALAGLLGPGPLSRERAGQPGSALWVEYQRFERCRSPVTLRVHLGSRSAAGGLQAGAPAGFPAAAGDGRLTPVRLAISRDYLQGVELQRIEPPPDSVQAGTLDLTYVFHIAQLPTEVRFHLEPTRCGGTTLQIARDGDPPLSARQFFFP